MMPQIIILILCQVMLLYAAYMHGKPRKEEKYNFWEALLNMILTLALLYWGGFFDKMLQ